MPDNRSYPHQDPQKEIKKLTEAFGADRLMYGGGFGEKATGKSYKAEPRTHRGLLTRLTDADHAKIFGGTAAKLFKLLPK